MNYITTADRVIVKPDEEREKTASGFIIAYDNDPTSLGTVVQVGPGRVTKKNVVIQVEVDPGDRIMFVRGSGIPIKINGEEYLILKEEEIMGVVT
jgi:chaperonin GroES